MPRKAPRRGRRSSSAGPILISLLTVAVLVVLFVGWPRWAARRPAPVRAATKPMATRPKPTAPAAAAAPVAAASSPPQRSARMAIVIDDLGHDVALVRATIDRLPDAIAGAVIPGAAHDRECARQLTAAGRELLCHLPMEPDDGDPDYVRGVELIHAEMSDDAMAAFLADAFGRVPGAVGLNNHMGSRATRDRALMDRVFGALRGRRLYFLDSRTTGGSVAEAAARAAGFRTLHRDVFLDDDRRSEAVTAAFRHLLELARAQGRAIGIAHPHAATLEVLVRELKALPDDVRLVRPSAL